MKRAIVCVLALLLLTLLPGCRSSPGQEGSPKSVPASSAPPASFPPAQPAGSAVSASEPPAAGPPQALTMYEDIEDVPGAEYSLTVLETEMDRPGEIWKNGSSFLAPPGESSFVDPVFADSRYLYVRALWPDGHFQWYHFEWVLSDPNAEIVIAGSQEKMFTGVDGTLLLCDDGTAFDTAAWQWVTP